MITPTSYDELLEVCGRVRKRFPMVGGGLVDRHLTAEDPALPYARRALGYITARSTDGLESELEAFATVSMDFLRLQARFMKTRRYARASAHELVDELYADESKMKGYYLDGLAMTYALWPNHARLIAFMCEQFLSGLKSGSRVVEVGVGHGLLAALLFDLVPEVTYVGVDISATALDYARSSLDSLGVDDHRWTLVNADAMSRDVRLLVGDDGFDAAICCEVVEHVDEPQDLLASLSSLLGSGGTGFVSTVANMEADDHVFLFHDVEHIRAVLRASGWLVDVDLANVLPGADSWDPLPVNYCALLRPDRTA